MAKAWLYLCNSRYWGRTFIVRTRWLVEGCTGILYAYTAAKKLEYGRLHDVGFVPSRTMQNPLPKMHALLCVRLCLRHGLVCVPHAPAGSTQITRHGSKFKTFTVRTRWLVEGWTGILYANAAAEVYMWSNARRWLCTFTQRARTPTQDTWAAQL